MTSFPTKANIQKLITSHPDGVEGDPPGPGMEHPPTEHAGCH